MKKYKTYADFDAVNSKAFAVVQQAVAQLKSPDQLGQETGMAIAEMEKLSHFFLKCANGCTDLLFGMSASVLDASAHMNSTEGLIYGQKAGGATDRNRAVANDPIYLQAVRDFNDLTDLKKYLEMKRDDFMANHYYYKGLTGANK